MKLPPTGYKTAAESAMPGYLAKRMAVYRDRAKAEKESRERESTVRELPGLRKAAGGK